MPLSEPAAHPVFDQALRAALARGERPDLALSRAQAALREQLAFEAASARRPENQLRQGASGAPPDPVFDAIAAAGLAQGLSLQQALQRALQRTRALDAPLDRSVPSDNTPQAALSSGLRVNAVAELAGNSRVYRATLGQALARGLDLQRAIALAQQAEQRATVSFSLPLDIRQSLAGPRASVALSALDGAPAPDWIRLDLQRQRFVAVDIPSGGLPLALVLTIGTVRYAVTVQEIEVPGVPAVARLP